jgi:hypothetical protein
MFSEKRITIEIALGAGGFRNAIGSEGFAVGYGPTINGIQIAGNACTVNISKLGMNSKNNAEVTIYGLSQKDIDKLTFLAFGPREAVKNTIKIYAGDENSQPLAFSGDIFPGGAYGVYANNEPALHINAITNYLDSITPAQPTSIEGPMSGVDMVKNLVEQQLDGASFINSLLPQSPTLTDAFFDGSVIKQMQDMSEAAGLELVIDDNVVILLEPGMPRGDANMTVISSETGLIGYPAFSQVGVNFQCIYDPSLVFAGLVKLESKLPKANGVWRINSVSHSLSYGIPGGPWESSIGTNYIVGGAK